MQLTEKRWYPGTVTLADGRALVIQGSATPGSGYRVEPNVEILPLLEGCPDRTNPKCSIPISVLQRSMDRNSEKALYPYATVLPNGNLFLFCGQFSSILDTASETFEEIKELPILLDRPGQKESEAPSRSYPGSGSFVLLPLDPDDGYKATVLGCGGSYADKKVDSQCLDTCATIEPLSENPQWEYGKMKGPRVMLDLILLPNEEVLIINGARLGYADFDGVKFGEAEHEALIYDPKVSDPNKRTRSAGESPISRVYHSVALLLPDGRVWVRSRKLNTGCGTKCRKKRALHERASCRVLHSSLSSWGNSPSRVHFTRTQAGLEG